MAFLNSCLLLLGVGVYCNPLDRRFISNSFNCLVYKLIIFGSTHFFVAVVVVVAEIFGRVLVCFHLKILIYSSADVGCTVSSICIPYKIVLPVIVVVVVILVAVVIVIVEVTGSFPLFLLLCFIVYTFFIARILWHGVLFSSIPVTCIPFWSSRWPLLLIARGFVFVFLGGILIDNFSKTRFISCWSIW